MGEAPCTRSLVADYEAAYEKVYTAGNDRDSIGSSIISSPQRRLAQTPGGEATPEREYQGTKEKTLNEMLKNFKYAPNENLKKLNDMKRKATKARI